MTPQQFIAKWQPVTLSERSACQSHFNDLCLVLGQPQPVEADPEGAWYTFERGVNKLDGGHGWADVWMRGKFGWEYKKKRKDLKAAFDQLLQYRDALENPPLLVVCDLDRFEIHTNFTGTAKKVYEFDLAGLADPRNLDVLRKTFSDPDALKPGETPESVTQRVATQIGTLADGLKQRKVAADDLAHFLMKLVFCMFAEDIGLLGEKRIVAGGKTEPGLFTRLVRSAKSDPAKLSKQLRELFTSMTVGGDFWGEEILHFNGGLFADARVVDLTAAEIQHLADACIPDWENVEPSIFGTLFERILDPDKRSQLGAHYTSRADIETLLEPVVMQPLRREWGEVQAQCDEHVAASATAKTAAAKKKQLAARDKALKGFVERLSQVTILDPACGSGNFLYVALHLLLDLEKEVIAYAARQGIGLFPQVRPTQLAGIEINPYAQELASVVIWIGYLQWMHHNGFNPPANPVLEPIESIRRMDAILDLSDPEHPSEPEWPEAEFIVGNPPFLGGKIMRSELGDEYMDALFAVWRERVKPEADLCCYWFEKGRSALERERSKRAGLLATQGIRGGANRETLNRIKESGDIYFAVSDREWVLDGANVHISMVGFDVGEETTRVLDGANVATINANLTATADIGSARRLDQNAGLGFMGTTKQGPFDIPQSRAIEWLQSPNPHGRPNSDVVFPWLNGMAVTKRVDPMWIVDFFQLGLDDAAKYEAPFAHVDANVRKARDAKPRDWYRAEWWQLYAQRPEMRTALRGRGRDRFIATARVSKHRLFAWLNLPTNPDCQLIVFARSDDYFFGVLHSRLHEVWALRLGTRLETRPRYTPTTCFETFPFPEPTDDQREAIAEAARELDRLRTNWLNPPEWTRTEVLEFPGTVGGPWDRYIETADSRQPTADSRQPTADSRQPTAQRCARGRRDRQRAIPPSCAAGCGVCGEAQKAHAHQPLQRAADLARPRAPPAR
jgi:SAM-dependent methyltransferase